MLKSKLLKVFASKIRGVLGGGEGCLFWVILQIFRFLLPLECKFIRFEENSEIIKAPN